MRIDFRVRTQRVLRPIIPTQAQENTLARIYLAIPRVWSEAATNRIIPAYSRTLSQMARDSVSDIEFEIAETDSTILRAVLTFQNAFRAWGADFSMWHFRRFAANLKYATNVDLGDILGADDSDTMAAILSRNVALVRSVSDQTRERIQDIVYRGVTNRTPVAEVAKEIAQATGLAKARSRRIASDQLVKMSAALDESRMRDIGIDSFKWMHSHKKNFRPHHKERDGRIFKWDDPEIRSDKPGFAPFCGCKARGVIEGDG